MNIKEFLSTASADHELARDEARAFEVTSYRKIGGNEARQFFAMTGQLKNIESNLSNTTVVQVIPGFDATIGELCSALLDTLKAGSFATDPGTQDGTLNRTASQLLVDNGVITQPAKDMFFGMSESVTKPFENINKYEVMINRGAHIPKIKVTPVDGVVTVQNTIETDSFNPVIYRRLGNGFAVVSRFQAIKDAREYSIQIPKNTQSVFIDNPYNSLEGEV